MTKPKKSSKHQGDQPENNEDQPENNEDQPETMNIATFALTMAVEARILGLSAFLFPLLQRIEDGEKITEKDILDMLSSVKIGNKTALEKLQYLREHQ